MSRIFLICLLLSTGCTSTNMQQPATQGALSKTDAVEASENAWVTFTREFDTGTDDYPVSVTLANPTLRTTPSAVNARGTAQVLLVRVSQDEMVALIHVLTDHGLFSRREPPEDSDHSYLIVLFAHPPGASEPRSRSIRVSRAEFAAICQAVQRVVSSPDASEAMERVLRPSLGR